MSQQINLYHPIFRKEEKKFSAKAMAQGMAILLLAIFVLMLPSAWQIFGLEKLQKNYQQRLNQSDREIAQFTAISSARPGQTGSLSAADRMEQLIGARKQVATLLQSDAYSNRTGYSQQLIALSRRHLRGMWLTAFEFSTGEKKVTVQGRTYKAELVPRYIKGLAQEPSLQGIQFQTFNISQPKLEPGKKPVNYLEFIVTTLSQSEVPLP